VCVSDRVVLTAGRSIGGTHWGGCVERVAARERWRTRRPSSAASRQTSLVVLALFSASGGRLLPASCPHSLTHTHTHYHSSRGRAAATRRCASDTQATPTNSRSGRNGGDRGRRTPGGSSGAVGEQRRRLCALSLRARPPRRPLMRLSLREMLSALLMVLAAGCGPAAAVGGPQHRSAAGAAARTASQQQAPLTNVASSNSGTACDFERPCSWQWKNNTTPPGFNVVSGKFVNSSFYNTPNNNVTGPLADFSGNPEGQFFFFRIFLDGPKFVRARPVVDL
jgi:hypothetical protein